MIDTSNWKEFRVGDLFDVSRPSSRSSQNYDEGDMPFVASGNFNNGVTAYLQPKDDNDYDEGGCITVSAVDGYAFYQKDKFLGRGGAGSSIMILRNDTLNELNGKYICTLIRKACNDWKYSNMGNKGKLADTMIWFPITSTGEPDWQYMESYMKAIMEESEKSLENLKKADDTKHLIDVSGWGEFKLSNLFTKKTMKGYPKKAESYEEVENGYHIYGQNIGWQYPYKVLMDEQYLHKVESDKPILAYTSSVGEIGLINESFYRSGDNGAFQGLFPIGYHPNLLQMQFVLSILKKEFEAFRYDTSMQNTMDITFKLPITSTGEPDWQYMEDYMRRIMDKSEQIISDLQIGV